MSGRSAHVRKKITETKKEELRQAQDLAYNVSELPVSSHAQQGHYAEDYGVSGPSDHRPMFADSKRGSDASEDHGRESLVERRMEANAIRPLDDFAYARARKPNIKPEDMTGITKSGVRSAYDKKSEDFRKGLSKAFGFKGKKGKAVDDIDAARRPSAGRGGPFNGESGRRESVNQIYELPGDTTEGPPTLPPPNTQLPPLPSELQARRWIGTGRPVQRWNKLRKDPELWDPNGDVLIYLSSKEQHPRPDPSFRLSSRIIESTDSSHLITMLREGVSEDLDDNLSSSSAGTPALSAVGISPFRPSMAPLSPVSDHQSAITDGGISYELYFPPPANANKVDQLRYQLTTRNVFAILCHVSLVGLSLHQALSDLLARLEEYVPQQEVDNVLTIMSYLSARAIDDVRNDAETAIGLLAWSEDPKVRWEEAWREAFVHAAGLYGTSRGRMLMESAPDFKRISPITRALLERASLEMQLRVQAAEERLAGFSFGDMWPMSVSVVASMSGALVTSPAKDAADRLQRFLLEYCRIIYGGRWPPPPPSNETLQPSDANAEEPIWLTRTVAQALQRDFGALYDYLVNRDIVWDMSEARPSRKWLMVSESGNKAFEADTTDLPMMDILIEFDNRQRFPHVPHPFPLVPESVPTHAISPGAASSTNGAMSTASSSSSFLKRSRNTSRVDTYDPMSSSATGPNPHRAAAMERRVQLAYTEATNIYVLGSDFTQSDLIDAFVRFEKTDRVGDVDPSLARRARWILLYGILQTLASVSVDMPSVRYREGVPYHLSPQLKGARLPPWAKKPKHSVTSTATAGLMEEAAHELSHCWTTALLWTNSSTSASEDDDAVAASPPLLDDATRMLGFPYPPPLALSVTSRGGGGATTTDSDAGSTTQAWLLHNASSQSTTRATTPATSANPISPVFPSSSSQFSPLSRKTSQLARVASADGEWSPVRSRVEMGFERARRELSSPTAEARGSRALSSSDAGSASASASAVGGMQPRRRPRKKNVEELMGMDAGWSQGEGSVSPRERGWERDFEEFGGDGERERAHLAGADRVVEPVIRDFDALGVDDIMP